MSLSRLWQFMNPMDKVIGTRVLRAIHTPETFASILNRERDRTDRTGQEFSLVVFDDGCEETILDAARYLIPILKRHIRTTDEIGWFDGRRLGVALPHTPPDGAWKFVDKIRQAVGEGMRVPDCMVYAYPSWWIASDDKGPSKGARTGNSKTASGEGKSHIDRSSNIALLERARPMEDVGCLFLRRFPAWKRAIDITGSLIGLILLMPLFLLVGLFIKLVSPGPVFFRQERIGYLGKAFSIWKFRTMHVNADTAVHQRYLSDLINNEKSMIKLDNGNDPRIIPFGTVLRKTAIDELPQLINVLLGDMSLVGPRPCIPYEAREFDAWQKRRFDTVPGLTGLWQVSGKNRTTFKEMMRLDIAYARKRAFLLDLKIFLKTIPAIVDQVVADRPAYARARSKALSVAHRAGMVFLAALTLNRFHR